jgi:diguanylate cyclase (GGDEF)-like protein
MNTAKINLLVIEDNPGDARLVVDLLHEARPEKYVIECVATLKEALRSIENNTYEIILTDLALPDSEGYDIVSSILAHDDEIPIIVLSGQDSDALAIKVVQMGAQVYLVKGQGDGYLINRAIGYAIERKKIQKGLNYLAQYDSLTGLANRLLFKERLEHAITRADRTKSMVGLMFIDLDRFKNINDTLGHDAGDTLLVEVGERLKKCTRESDTIARLGGDEFTVILEDINHIEDASLVALNILEAMADRFKLNDNDVFISPSIGITLYPLDECGYDGLLKNADTAMYQAKDAGRNCYRFYTAEMNEQLLAQMTMETKLRNAIEKQEFVLHYQPKFNIYSRELIGAEALIRWSDPDKGMISPALFIPLAEETGLIGSITDWVIGEACKQNSKWQLQGYKPFRMAINLSPKQFNQDDIAKRIVSQIICSDLSPKYVELEITEGALVKDVEKSNEILNELKMKGVHVSIDDFGTGYSSLSYLKKFPLDTLKIDQSFVRDIMIDADDAAIVSAIIAMAKSLRLNVIAEGVETQAQLDYLQAKGCNEAQGYYLGRPLPADEFVRFLSSKSDSSTTPIIHCA